MVCYFLVGGNLCCGVGVGLVWCWVVGIWWVSWSRCLGCCWYVVFGVWLVVGCYCFVVMWWSIGVWKVELVYLVVFVGVSWLGVWKNLVVGVWLGFVLGFVWCFWLLFVFGCLGDVVVVICGCVWVFGVEWFLVDCWCVIGWCCWLVYVGLVVRLICFGC